MKIMIDQKQLENVEYLNYLCSMIKNDARCTREIKTRIAMTKAAFNKKKKPVKRYIWSIAFYSAETWKLRKVYQKYLESFKCGAGEEWRRSVGPIV